jgi:type IV secretion system protein VirB4
MGQRSFSLPLGPLGVNCLASNRAEDHALMDTLMAQEGPEGFAAAWFRAHGFTEEARYVERYHTLALGTPPGAEPDRVC